MEVIGLTVGPFAENTYLLTKQGDALLIDPGFSRKEEFNKIREELSEEQAELKAVVLTHAHVDHILGLDMVLEAFDLPVYLNDEDRYLWNNISSQAEMFGFRVDPFDFEPEPLRPQERWQLGAFTFEIRYTPGHAPDHVVLYDEEEGVLIAGDTLFKQGIGRTDLYKGDFKLLEKSIREQLYTLPGDTIIYPGHGPQTTIEFEKKENPFVRAGN